MIKLITQFDNEKSKLSLATPTCGCCCCCCCCCIASTFTTASISARNFGDYVEKKLPNEPKKIKMARTFGFWFPIGLLISLALGLFIVSLIDLNAIFMLVAIGILYLIIMANILKEKIQLPGTTFKMIESSIMLVLFEILGLFIGFFAVMFLGWVYLIIAIIISILLICWAFREKYDDLENLKNSENIDKENSSSQTNEFISNMQTMKINNDNLNNKAIQEKLSSEIQSQKKKCSNCGNENAISNKRCSYCTNCFETDDDN